MVAAHPALVKALVRHARAPFRSAVRRAHGPVRETLSAETLSARYCYAVWLRHLVKANRYGLRTDPTSVAELGPGASLGVGIAALLTGAERYLALDVVRHANAAANLSVFDELVGLFHRRATIPDSVEFPEVRPRLGSFAFPDEILTADRLLRSLDGARVTELRERVRLDQLEYVVPWDDPAAIEAESVDLVFSQAVMEHVADLDTTYAAVFRWLKPGGTMWHQIDFRSHGTSPIWNGHWAYPDWMWRLVRGDAPINRQPLSRHLEAIEAAGFLRIACETEQAESGIDRTWLQPVWGWLDDRDLSCASALIQAVRPARPQPRIAGIS